MNKKLPYIAPAFQIVEIRVENGFVGSGGGPDMLFYMWLFDDTKSDNNTAATYSTEDWNW